MLYRTCPYCGAHNDPCEICDCRTVAREDEAKMDDGGASKEQLAFDMPRPEEPKVHKHHNVAI